MCSALLTFAEVSCARGGRQLFERFNLTLKAGDCVALRGANGSGKSTLLRAAAGLFADFNGAVDAASFHYVGHKHGVSALLSPKENLLMHERLAGSTRWWPAAAPEAAVGDALPFGGVSAAQALAQVGLGGAPDTACSQLSEGQRRRVALARLLLERRPLWLLDEPLTALDADGRRLVQELITAHCQAGGAVLCATHQALSCPSATEVQLGGGA